MNILHLFFICLFCSPVFIKNSDSDSDDFVDMDGAFIDADGCLSTALREKNRNVSQLRLHQMAKENSRLLPPRKAKQPAQVAVIDEYRNHRIFLNMWLEGSKDGRAISPFCVNRSLIAKEIDAYVSLQDSDFRGWYKKTVSIWLVQQLC